MSTVLGVLKSRLQTAKAAAGFVWDRAIGRYRSRATGRLVGEKRILRVAERFGEYTERNIDDLTEQLLDGRLQLGEWQEQMAAELKNMHLVSHMAGRGGRYTMTQADFGQVGGRLRSEYGYLNRFARAIKDGELTEAQIRDRARSYAGKCRAAFYDGQTRAKGAADEFTEERRLLNPAEHCEDCQRWADMGWQPIGTLPPPGEQSVCMGNCQCEKEYR